jgi:hypothetical protein
MFYFYLLNYVNYITPKINLKEEREKIFVSREVTGGIKYRY